MTALPDRDNKGTLTHCTAIPIHRFTSQYQHMIKYTSDLNPAQYEAATTLEGPVLVIAGAGSGKTRTIVYRLARLVETGVPASSILLLTFTRKAAQEMLERARNLLLTGTTSPLRGSGVFPPLSGPVPEAREASPHLTDIAAVQGGTFHSFAFSILRLFQPHGFASRLTVMDNADMISALAHCRDILKAGKGDRSFPKNPKLLSLLSKCRNKELPLENILVRESGHLLPHCRVMEEVGAAYARFKQEKSLLDYDDLLFTLEETLRSRPEALAYCRNKFRYIMVDEYQDTNPVQARIAALVAGGAIDDAASGPSGPGNIMAVGDDAQSIYSFRGADVRNILRFPELFPNTKIIRLEENYRSTQPILDLTNGLLRNAAEGYAKELFTANEGGTKPSIIRPVSDRTEAQIVTSRVVELLNRYPAREIAVLFRSGFHSYHTELQLNKLGIHFRKYGGMRYAEAAHVKDAMSFLRLVQNPLDYTAFSRVAALCKGVGPKTCLKIYQTLTSGRGEKLGPLLTKYPDMAEDLNIIDKLRKGGHEPGPLLEEVVEHYRPRLMLLYPDDYPRRQQGLEQLVFIASGYKDLDLFISDLSLDDPLGEDEKDPSSVTLSTIHSAKGLEWSAVLVLDLVEDRFPSRHSMVREEEYEEERRLLYVACTRAREHLDLFVPATTFDRGSGGTVQATPSPFVREIAPALYEELQEGYSGTVVRREILVQEKQRKAEAALSAFRAASRAEQAGPYGPAPEGEPAAAPSPARPEECGFCHHKIFGRGKIVQHLSDDKFRVNFPGFGLKVIMSAFLTLEK